jgi:hypothetical protein
MGAGSDDPETFWRDYEAQHGERVEAFTLGRYLSGWDELPEPLWGLLIATDGGFRFHHFAQESWFGGLSRGSSGKGPSGKGAPKEHAFFIPKGWILQAELRQERSWIRRLITGSQPTLAIRYAKPGSAEALLLAETDLRAKAVADALSRGGEAPGTTSG